MSGQGSLEVNKTGEICWTLILESKILDTILEAT